MRVPLRLRDDRGAVAAVVAILSLVFLLIAAFTVDAGRAYVQKRQLSTSADAASLAAARVYSGYTGTCAQLSNQSLPTSAAAYAAAQTAANAARGDNISGAS